MPEWTEGDAENCEFLEVSIPKSPGDLGDSTGNSIEFGCGGI
jgi:hypothetical protein